MKYMKRMLLAIFPNRVKNIEVIDPEIVEADEIHE